MKYSLTYPLGWHAPKAFLRRVSQHRLEEAIVDNSYMEDYRRVTSAYDAYRGHRVRPELTNFFDTREDLIAYTRHWTGQRGGSDAS